MISTAVGRTIPKVLAARARRIPVVPRAMMLAELMRLRQGIAMAGTHGKTTTTSLIASVLAEAGIDPTFVIGGRLEAAGSHAKLGTGEFIVVEADESDASFLYLQPMLAVITNIDADHMETYGHDFERLKQAFVEFIEAPAVLRQGDAVRGRCQRARDPAAHQQAGDDLRSVRRCADSCGERARMRAARCALPRARGNGSDRRRSWISRSTLPGVHNVLNALAAIAIGLEVGVPERAIVAALAEFEGVGRRFQRYGEVALPAAAASL